MIIDIVQEKRVDRDSDMLKKGIDILVNGCAELNIDLSERQIEQFMIYYDFLIEKNKVMNLTGITEFEEVMMKHFVDSVAVVKAVDMKQVKRLLDMGTGAGFPGVPLKIVFPDTEIVLMDSLNKRILFLNELIDKCRLNGITAVHGRAEEFAKNKEYREKFDLCVSRAVANLSSLSEYCIPYVRKGGMFIPYKSGNIDMELQNAVHAIQVLGGKLKEVIKFQLPESDIDRSLVVIEKVKETAKKYPRKAGTPVKEPL